MAIEAATFEVHVMKNGRWQQQSLHDKEEAAVAIAKRLFEDKRCEGARVLRNWSRMDGKFVEKEVWGQTRALNDDEPIRISAIDDAPMVCVTPDDFLSQESRTIANRLFRSYLEKVTVTPTELLHNWRELKRLQDRDTLLPSGVDRIAFLQTRDGQGDQRNRRDEIYRSLDQISAKARNAEHMDLPKVNGSFKAMYDRVARMARGDEEADYLAMTALSRELVELRNWLGKLDRLCQLAVAEGDTHSLTLLDGVIADVLGANVVQEILGWQPSLGAAICAMVDLSEGRFANTKDPGCESTVTLNSLFGARKLPISRLCLIDRAHRQLRSPNPLYRSDPSREMEAYRKVVARLVDSNGPAFGGDTAEALTTRYTRMVEEGGAAGRRAAIQGAFHAMPDLACAVMFLCALNTTAYGASNGADIEAGFDRVFASRTVATLCERGLPPKEKMVRLTNAHGMMSASAFPDALKERVRNHVDQALESFLIEEQLIEKLDHPDSPLRDRAVRLVQFCAAGVLPEGRALARARERILIILRQPNFDAHFIEGIADAGRAQKAVRDFYALLNRAGFSP